MKNYGIHSQKKFIPFFHPHKIHPDVQRIIDLGYEVSYNSHDLGIRELAIQIDREDFFSGDFSRNRPKKSYYTKNEVSNILVSLGFSDDLVNIIQEQRF